MDVRRLIKAFLFAAFIFLAIFIFTGGFLALSLIAAQRALFCSFWVTCSNQWEDNQTLFVFFLGLDYTILTAFVYWKIKPTKLFEERD